MKMANLGHLYEPPTLSYNYLIRVFKYYGFFDYDCFCIDDLLFMLEDSRCSEKNKILIKKLKELKCQE